jgi:hypothetical protein
LFVHFWLSARVTTPERRLANALQKERRRNVVVARVGGTAGALANSYLLMISKKEKSNRFGRKTINPIAPASVREAVRASILARSNSAGKFIGCLVDFMVNMLRFF